MGFGTMGPNGPTHRGYAIFMVLLFLVLLSILTITLSETAVLSQKYAFRTVMEVKGLNTADAGVAFALESIRQSGGTPWWTIVSSGSVAWNQIESENGTSVCFKTFPEAPPASNQLKILSYGEVVNGNCGDYSGKTDAILSARILSAAIDLTPGREKVVHWQEVLP